MNIGKFKLSRKWTIFSVTANGTFMSTLSAGIVNIALPTMATQFHVTLESIQLVVSMYLLVLTCLLPVFGKLSDMYSRKWMYLGGFITFGVGAVLGAVAGSLPTMLLARAVQGVGSSAMMATSQALIAQIFHGKARGKAFGAIGAVVACGSLAGPALGGALIQAWGWPSVFWISVPVCILGVWRGIYLIPRFRAVKKLKMDWYSALCYVVTSFAFLYALNMGATLGWTSGRILSAFALAAVFLGLFLRREKVSKSPFIGVEIFRIPAISYGLVVALLGFTSLFTNSVLLPFYLTDILHMDPIQIGLLMLPFPVTLAAASAVSGALCAKWPARIITTVGFFFLLTGTLMFALIGSSPSISYIVLAHLVMGAGSGTFQVPNNNTVVSAAPKGQLGVVASVNALARNVGMVSGIALSVAVFSAVQAWALKSGVEAAPAFIRGYSAALLFGALCAVAGGILSAKRDEWPQ
ncbi:MFS transporter [Candidatus Avelusimicrobium facis]|uniref:MFS transporter n=1 Tax=Candidatus Avelusimicrobium facis TaxID=3416203 RepID=UPI003D0E1C6F